MEANDPTDQFPTTCRHLQTPADIHAFVEIVPSTPRDREPTDYAHHERWDLGYPEDNNRPTLTLKQREPEHPFTLSLTTPIFSTPWIEGNLSDWAVRQTVNDHQLYTELLLPGGKAPDPEEYHSAARLGFAGPDAKLVEDNGSAIQILNYADVDRPVQTYAFEQISDQKEPSNGNTSNNSTEDANESVDSMFSGQPETGSTADIMDRRRPNGGFRSSRQRNRARSRSKHTGGHHANYKR